MAELPVRPDDPRATTRSKVLAHEAEVRAQSRLVGPLTLRSLADLFASAPEEVKDLPIVFPDPEQKVFVQLYAALIDPKACLASNVYDVPPGVPTAEHTKFYAKREVIVLRFQRPARSLDKYWERQDQILSVWGSRRDTGTTYCSIHQRLWPTERWPECPHCIKARGLTPEEVRERIIK